jgi:hypothetical protein
LLYNVGDLLLGQVPSKVPSKVPPLLKSPFKDLTTLKGLTGEVPKDLLAVRTPSKDQPITEGLSKDLKPVKDLISTLLVKEVPFKASPAKESLTSLL